MQVRKKTDPRVVEKYAEAIESGSPFPPVNLACIGGALVLVDGWHRLSARKVLGEVKVVAFVSTMSYGDARLTSALANLANGVPLRPAEVLEAFHTFMDTQGYRIGYSWLSYREIAKKFGKPHSTIRNWMRKYYPRIFKRYQQDEGKGTYKDWNCVLGAVPSKRPSSSDSLATGIVKQAKAAIANTLNLGDTLDPSSRGEVIETLRQALQVLEGEPYFLPFGSDF
jgi:transposase-like protein